MLVPQKINAYDFNDLDIQTYRRAPGHRYGMTNSEIKSKIAKSNFLPFGVAVMNSVANIASFGERNGEYIQSCDMTGAFDKDGNGLPIFPNVNGFTNLPSFGGITLDSRCTNNPECPKEIDSNFGHGDTKYYHAGSMVQLADSGRITVRLNTPVKRGDLVTVCIAPDPVNGWKIGYFGSDIMGGKSLILHGATYYDDSFLDAGKSESIIGVIELSLGARFEKIAV